MSEALTLNPPERERFELLKRAVSDGMAICFIVGSALREIKERKFYVADGHKTFDAFCDAEWGWTKRYCNQLILDAAAINSLPESMRKLITSHKAAAELARIPEILRPAVVQAATQGGTKPATASTIKKSSPPPRKAAGTSGSRAKKSSPPPRKSSPPARKKAGSAALRDSTGLEVPTECLALWNRGDDARQIVTYASAIRGRLKRAQEEKDLLFVEVDFTDNLAKLNQVILDLQRARPHAICPSCQGKLQKDCTTCKGRGFVSEFYWNTCVPDEVKALRKTALSDAKS